MSQYPTELAPNVEPLPGFIDQAELNAKGLVVVRGLTLGLAEQLPKRSQEPAVIEFTPNDYIRPDTGKPGRFFDVNSVVEWIAKGRLALPLITTDEKLMGILWMGPEKPGQEEPEIPGANTTFAIRIYEGAAGQLNSLPYTKIGLAMHAELYNNDGVWLEAWGDNPKALNTYEKVGFIEEVRDVSKRHGQPKERVYMTLGKLAVS